MENVFTQSTKTLRKQVFSEPKYFHQDVPLYVSNAIFSILRKFFSKVTIFRSKYQKKIYQKTLKRMFLLRNIHLTCRIKFSHSCWCPFNSFFLLQVWKQWNKTFFEKFSPKTFLSKSGAEWWQPCRKQLPQNPKCFPSMPSNILQKKSFLMQKFSPRTFLWTHRIEYLEPGQLLFFRKCKLVRS